jgi:hypothetical protein
LGSNLEKLSNRSFWGHKILKVVKHKKGLRANLLTKVGIHKIFYENSQEFLVTYGLKILRLFRRKALFEAVIIKQ